MIRLVQEAYTNTSDKLDLSTLNFMDGVAADQALSMINYYVSDSSEAESGDFAIIMSAKLYVWPYGLNSRTTTIGIIVLFVGIVCVLGRAAIAALVVVERQEYMTPTPLGKLILAALEHALDRIEERWARFSIQKRTVSLSHG